MVTGLKPGDTKPSTKIYYSVRIASNVTVDKRSVLVVYNQHGYHVYYSPFSAYYL